MVQLRQGDSFNIRRAIAGYSSTDGWALTCLISNASNAYSITATANADGSFTTTALPAITAAWVAGLYRMGWRLTKGDEAHTLSTEPLQILPSLASTAEARSTARQLLEAVEATLKGRVTADIENYRLPSGQQVAKLPLADLIKLRNRLQNEIASEDAADRLAAGLGSGRTIRVRF